MAEFRKDAILDRWVIVAPHRATRPQAVKSAAPPTSDDPCPFCRGQEDQTPGEVFACRPEPTAANGPEWALRVVPNKYPALDADASSMDPGGLPGPSCEIEATVQRTADEDLQQSQPAFGIHEVVIESPRHVASASDLSSLEIGQAFMAYRQRFREFRRDPRLRYAIAIKNVGAEAGASLEHTHSQLLALPMVPASAEEELSGSLAYHARHGRCVFCAMLEREIAVGERLVFLSDDCVAFCPYASRLPFETWIMPRAHNSHFEDASDHTVLAVAEATRHVLERLDGHLGRPAYNYLLHSAPFDRQAIPHYHWHIEILPTLTRTAGFEWGTNCFINTVPPEEAAARLVNGSPFGTAAVPQG